MYRVTGLKQNYPNPFNPLTINQYTIGGEASGMRNGDVSLILYDVLGREVAVLVHEVKQPGA